MSLFVYDRSVMSDTDSRNIVRRKGPILVSLGSVLIDAFDFPPPQLLNHIESKSKEGSVDGPVPPPRERSASNVPLLKNKEGGGSDLHERDGTPTRSTHTTSPSHSPSSSSPPQPSSAPSLTQPNFHPHAQSRAPTPQQSLFHIPPPQNPYQVLGGGALYALIGARMWLDPGELGTLIDTCYGGGELGEGLMGQLEVFRGSGRGRPANERRKRSVTGTGDSQGKGKGSGKGCGHGTGLANQSGMGSVGAVEYEGASRGGDERGYGHVNGNGNGNENGLASIGDFRNGTAGGKSSTDGTEVGEGTGSHIGAEYGNGMWNGKINGRLEYNGRKPANGRGMWYWNEGVGLGIPRARIRYEGDVRMFQSIIKPPHRSLADLKGTPLESSEYLHLSPPYSPEDVVKLLREMEWLESGWTPKLVFEPTPPSCHPGQKGFLEEVARGVEVLSPNHEEILSFYNHPLVPLTNPNLIPTIESIIHHLLFTVRCKRIIVIRCGRLGSCVGTREGGMKWFPAFFEGEDEKRVLDFTGAGNAFLGGYVAGLSKCNGDAYEAVLYATVSASFVVEQFGLPSLTFTDNGEFWNGDEPSERLEMFRSRLGR